MKDRYVECNISKFIRHTISTLLVLRIYIKLRYSKPGSMQKYENMLEYAKEGEPTQYTKTAKHMHYVIT